MKQQLVAIFWQSYILYKEKSHIAFCEMFVMSSEKFVTKTALHRLQNSGMSRLKDTAILHSQIEFQSIFQTSKKPLEFKVEC